MATKDFAAYVQGKNFDEILHEGRRESADRLMSEALVPLALLLSREASLLTSSGQLAQNLTLARLRYSG